jgi:subtilisin family serine protease
MARSSRHKEVLTDLAQARITALLSSLCLVALVGCGGGEDDGITIPLPSPPLFSPTYFAWMNAEIQSAWADGFFGQGSRVMVVDDFQGSYTLLGNLGLGRESKRHGEWVAQNVELMSPGAELATQDFSSSAAITLGAGKLNIINLSYGVPDTLGPNVPINWSPRETSIIAHANGAAVVVKSAGNNAVAIGDAYQNKYDYLSRDLIGKPTAIFAGALDRHGTVANPASLASYSNFAGTDPRVQEQFLVVGVTGGTLASGGTNLQGTSFAAPQLSAYAAILGSKFPRASALQVIDQLLDTARTDTIRGYDMQLHGQGEASLSRALAPQSIN